MASAIKLHFTDMAIRAPRIDRLEIGDWVAILAYHHTVKARVWEIYDHYPDQLGLERYRGLANAETSAALDRDLNATR